MIMVGPSYSSYNPCFPWLVSYFQRRKLFDNKQS